MEQDDFLKNYLEEYRKTDGYKENHRLMVLCKDDWRTFLAERIRETQGELPKEELLFWAAFLYEPEAGIQHLKRWIAWCKEKGTIGQQAYAEISEERLKKYVDGAKDGPQPKHMKCVGNLFDELTKREQHYYDKALQREMAEKTDDGYKWLYNGGKKVGLAYFLYKVFNPKGTGIIPYKRLNRLWGVSRIDSALSQALTTKNGKPQKWRKEIDELFAN